MVDRLIEKTRPSVKLEATTQTKGERTRSRILDVAYEAIVQKGFAATSIDELVEAAGITKSGFFYHFKDKNDLARQLLDRFLAEDEAIIDMLAERARNLSDDPLQSFLIFLNLYAEMMDDLPDLHPGCLVAAITYQEQLFDQEVVRLNRDSIVRMRTRFVDWLDAIATRNPPQSDIDLAAMADTLTVVVEGSIILSKALGDRELMGRQTRLFRQLVRLTFERGSQA